MPAASLPRPLARRLRTRCGRRGRRNRVREENVVSGERDLITLGRDAQKSRQQNLVFGTGYRYRRRFFRPDPWFPRQQCRNICDLCFFSTFLLFFLLSCFCCLFFFFSTFPLRVCNTRKDFYECNDIHSDLQVQTDRQRRPARDRIHFGTQHGSAVTREGQSHHVRERSIKREIRSSQAYNTKSSRQTSADSPMPKQSEDFLCPSFAMRPRNKMNPKNSRPAPGRGGHRIAKQWNLGMMLLPKTPRVTPAGLLRDIEDEDDVQATGQPPNICLSLSLSISLSLSLSVSISLPLPPALSLSPSPSLSLSLPFSLACSLARSLARSLSLFLSLSLSPSLFLSRVELSLQLSSSSFLAFKLSSYSSNSLAL